MQGNNKGGILNKRTRFAHAQRTSTINSAQIFFIYQARLEMLALIKVRKTLDDYFSLLYFGVGDVKKLKRQRIIVSLPN